MFEMTGHLKRLSQTRIYFLFYSQVPSSNKCRDLQFCMKQLSPQLICPALGQVKVLHLEWVSRKQSPEQTQRQAVIGK